jgi:hypothetical protein
LGVHRPSYLDICIYKELDTKDFLRVQDRHTKIGHTDLNEFFPLNNPSTL